MQYHNKNTRLYNAIAPYFDLLAQQRHGFAEETIFYDHLLSSTLNLNRDAIRLIEMGCATGNFISQMHKHGWQIDGIDSAEKMIKVAKAKNPRTQFYTSLPSDPNYDVCLSLDSFGAFLLTDTELEKFFADVAAVQPKYLVFDIRNHASRARTRDTSSRKNTVETATVAISYVLTPLHIDDEMHTWHHHYNIVDKETMSRRTIEGTLSMRFHHIENIENIARKYFTIVHHWGDYDSSVFSSVSPRWIAVLSPKLDKKLLT